MTVENETAVADLIVKTHSILPAVDEGHSARKDYVENHSFL